MVEVGSADLRHCTDRDRERPLSEFTKNAPRPDGSSSYCRDCSGARVRQSAALRRERDGLPPRPGVSRRRVEEGNKWCPRRSPGLPRDRFGRNAAARDGLTAYCRPCHNAYGTRFRHERYGGSRNYNLGHRYGIGAAEVQAMIDAQGGLRAACAIKPAEHVDHDHETGTVRDVLCFTCSVALGNVKDSTVILRALIAYLERHQPSARATPASAPGFVKLALGVWQLALAA